LLGAVALLSGLLFAAAQERHEAPQVKSRFTMARIRFSTPNFTWMRFGGYEPPWSHDSPRSEQHLMKIMAEVTRLDVNPDGHVTSFEDGDCFRYPVAYLCEVGYLNRASRRRRTWANTCCAAAS
jgi:hypothetical protein